MDVPFLSFADELWRIATKIRESQRGAIVSNFLHKSKKWHYTVIVRRSEIVISSIFSSQRRQFFLHFSDGNSRVDVEYNEERRTQVHIFSII